jgi:glucokinase
LFAEESLIAVGSRVLAYDVGGSHISAALCSKADLSLGAVVKAPLPEEQSAAAFFEVLTQLASRAGAESKNTAGAGFAMPGPFDYAEGISWMKHKMPYLYGVNLRKALADRMHWSGTQVRFLNDAAAYLLGEVGAGAGCGVSRVAGFTLGTGIGSGFAVNGHLVTEGPGVPPGGEIWNVPFEGGIVEDLVSTRAIRKAYRARTGTVKEVAEIAAGAANDSAAILIFAEFGRNLGRVLRILLREFAPEVVVLGGGIVGAAPLFVPAAQHELEGIALELRIALLGDRAPLVGAAVAWFAEAVESSQSSAFNPTK